MLIRTHKEPGDWFQMHKQPIENPDLSWKAKGILAYLMSKPPDWEVRISDLVKHATDGGSALRSGLAELERNGYLVRRTEHSKETGQFQWVCTVYETPAPKEEWSNPDNRKHSPSNGFPQMDNPQMENRQGTKNNPTKNNSTENEKDSSASGETSSAPPNPPPKAEKTPTPAQEMFTRLTQLCQYDPALLSKKDRGILNRVGKKLRDNDKLPTHLDRFEQYWYAADWRGKQGQAPAPHDVLSNWGRAKEWLNNGGGKSGHHAKRPTKRAVPSDPAADLEVARQVLAQRSVPQPAA